MERAKVGRPPTHPLLRMIPNISVKHMSQGGCWIYTGGLNSTGYAQLRLPHTSVPAHRWLYEFLYGKQDKQLDHLCRNRNCVNPKHLEPVTCRENLLRSPITQASINHNKVVCKRGHNNWTTLKKGSREGKRVCKDCANIRLRRWRAKGKG